jgi:ABC-2 type transport system ATP-binding protein
MTILKAESVRKNYLAKQALSELSLSVESGRIAGLLGPNGSGKTTFLKIVAGLVRPSGGNVSICGRELCYLTKNDVAYLPDSGFLYDWMKIKEAEKVYVKFYTDFSSERFAKLLGFMQLDSDMKVKSLSRGMKEKLGLTLTLARNAKLTVLDEPLAGVDPIARDQILGAILNDFSDDRSMLITSHMINEFETIFDDVFYLKDGRIALGGSVDELKEQRHMSLDEIYREVFAQ